MSVVLLASARSPSESATGERTACGPGALRQRQQAAARRHRDSAGRAAGDLLFSGDGLRTETGAASFLFCPAKAIETLAPSGEVRLDAKQPKVKTGKISEQPARACTLPATLRVAAASQQHYGVTMTRGAADKPQVPPAPRDRLPADVAAEIAPFETRTRRRSQRSSRAGERGNRVRENTTCRPTRWRFTKSFWSNGPKPCGSRARSSIWKKHWPRKPRSTAAAGPSGKTYALLVGISKYKKPELSLQFAHEDANLFDKLLESPLGGGLPPDQILLLMNEQATTAAVRNGFQDFLKRRAGKNDTVIILVAGHGTVEIPGSKNAFILTYDSDPQDLTSTALPMAEIRALFEDQLSKVGRVMLFVDVCKAGTIGTIQNTTVSADVQRLGEAPGDMFGLLASRPKEVSLEGPQFGGGHGVFSYYVVKGLEGAADANKDGVVDADELIEYVSDAGHRRRPANKQHPREFGTYENSLKLSDLSKPGRSPSAISDTAFSCSDDSRQRRAFAPGFGAGQRGRRAGLGPRYPQTAADLARFNACDSSRHDSAGRTRQRLRQDLPALQTGIESGALYRASEPASRGAGKPGAGSAAALPGRRSDILKPRTIPRRAAAIWKPLER